MNKGLQQIQARYADRVDNIYRDSDGIWVELKTGWAWPAEGECHGVHEYTTREIAAAMREVVPCRCENCQQMAAEEGITL